MNPSLQRYICICLGYAIYQLAAHGLSGEILQPTAAFICGAALLAVESWAHPERLFLTMEHPILMLFAACFCATSVALLLNCICGTQSFLLLTDMALGFFAVAASFSDAHNAAQKGQANA